MDFGKLPDPAALDGLDLTLPPDPPENALLLAQHPRTGPPEIYLGCPSWNHPEWMGKVYRPGPKSRDFLSEYVHQFTGIEVNATAYNLPSEKTVAHWAAVAPPGFRYCVKLPQTVTHYGSPLNKLPQTQAFTERMAPLAAHMGPALLQFSERFSPKSAPDLLAYLEQYPGGQRPAVELRHPGFFTPGGPPWLDWLTRLGCPAVITDTAGRRDVVHMRLTTPVALVRFTGNNLHPTDYARLDAWAQRLALWLEQGLHAAYFFVHTSPKEFCPELVAAFTQRLAATTGLPLPQWREVGG